MKKKLFILLGTYNGSKYVREQIKSIQYQTHEDWVLLVRDDGSSDETVELVDALAQDDPRITILDDEHGNVGASRNFSLLAQEALRQDADYVMFCDQDDIWMHDKVFVSLNKIKQAESAAKPNTPVLVHSDLTVTDEKLCLIHSSFLKMQHIRHEARHPLETLLVQNFVTGCTCIANKHLVKIAEPVPTEALMHDWWYALVAAHTGIIDYIPVPTLLYRQHGHNTIGASNYWSRINPFTTRLAQKLSKNERNYIQSIGQACALANRFTYTDTREQEIARNYCTVLKFSPWWRRILFLVKYRIRRQNPLLNFVLYLRAARTKPRNDSCDLSNTNN
ncbi:MAG: glycosyltransferase family 2 protein [Chromatiales bacterium]|nr:glycosyltransferase family 2 protein [Chromatiales bacterium]